MKKTLILLSIVMAISIHALDIDVEILEVKPSTNKYVLVPEKSFNEYFREKKLHRVKAHKIKESDFHIIEYFDENNKLIVKTIESSDAYGIDFKRLSKDVNKRTQ